MLAIARTLKASGKQQMRRLEALVTVARDARTGLYKQGYAGGELFLRSRSDYITTKVADWLCSQVYFREYLPVDGDTLVDIGAGFGHEALYLLARHRRIRYVGVEIQPSVYECLSNTFGPYRPAYTAFPMAITDAPELCIHSSSEYESVGSAEDAPVLVPTITWNHFVERFGIEKIDLLKVNIEGGERNLFDHLSSLDMVRRVIVSAHDFRADRGEGEHFRTRAFVSMRLQECGFTVRSLGSGEWWRDWLYAERQ